MSKVKVKISSNLIDSTVTHIRTKLSQLLVGIFSVFATTDRQTYGQTDRQTSPNTVPTLLSTAALS